ncbi:uncharacterized protein PAC_16430 [Phialocephala subalpina]|uniref:Uncharacterized protein n=1 Tax=Phialocephala subalpina TaxID=576137 RepID=A0A1L7XNB4_9HELO|nr:uncharacterized protein PAC_16430 [Phialocephala subalpina]
MLSYSAGISLASTEFYVSAGILAASTDALFDPGSSADNEDSPVKDEEDTIVKVYTFPMRPRTSITVKEHGERRTSFNEDSFVDIARLKKEFDQIDRILVTASSNCYPSALYTRQVSPAKAVGYPMLADAGGEVTANMLQRPDPGEALQSEELGEDVKEDDFEDEDDEEVDASEDHDGEKESDNGSSSPLRELEQPICRPDAVRVREILISEGNIIPPSPVERTIVRQATVAVWKHEYWSCETWDCILCIA